MWPIFKEKSNSSDFLHIRIARCPVPYLKFAWHIPMWLSEGMSHCWKKLNVRDVWKWAEDDRQWSNSVDWQGVGVVVDTELLTVALGVVSCGLRRIISDSLRRSTWRYVRRRANSAWCEISGYYSGTEEDCGIICIMVDRYQHLGADYILITNFDALIIIYS